MSLGCGSGKFRRSPDGTRTALKPPKNNRFAFRRAPRKAPSTRACKGFPLAGVHQLLLPGPCSTQQPHPPPVSLGCSTVGCQGSSSHHHVRAGPKAKGRKAEGRGQGKCHLRSNAMERPLSRDRRSAHCHAVLLPP